MSERVAVINMKGGVGKSTLCVNLAWHFAAANDWDKRVLLVDLDPQFNASQYLLGAPRYVSEVVKKSRPTIWDIFEQASRQPGLKSSGRTIQDCIVRAFTLSNGAYIDLIPSQLELSYTLKNPSEKHHLLAAFLDDVEADYWSSPGFMDSYGLVDSSRSRALLSWLIGD